MVGGWKSDEWRSANANSNLNLHIFPRIFKHIIVSSEQNETIPKTKEEKYAEELKIVAPPQNELKIKIVND